MVANLKHNIQSDDIMIPEAADLFNEDFLDLIRRMAYLAEYRKPNTLSHLERIRRYCLVIATGAGLSPTEAKTISYASQLHDIGEIEIPDAVITRAGQFTPYEWEMIKRHPFIGADLLRGAPSPLLQMAAVIALTHHERWDGSGYPRGLMGEEIPIGGRICGLADTFDALTTKRAYKAEIPVEAALKMVQEASELFFDPDLVEVFVQNFDEIVGIRKLNI